MVCVRKGKQIIMYNINQPLECHQCYFVHNSFSVCLHARDLTELRSLPYVVSRHNASWKQSQHVGCRTFQESLDTLWSTRETLTFKILSWGNQWQLSSVSSCRGRDQLTQQTEIPTCNSLLYFVIVSVRQRQCWLWLLTLYPSTVWRNILYRCLSTWVTLVEFWKEDGSWSQFNYWCRQAVVPSLRLDI